MARGLRRSRDAAESVEVYSPAEQQFIAYTARGSRLVQGGGPGRIMTVYGGVCAALSMWLSNTATTAMMFPIGLSIVNQLTADRPNGPDARRFALFAMLRGMSLAPTNRDLLRGELRRLGPMSTGQRNVLLAFAVSVTLWLVPGVFALAGGSDWPSARMFNLRMPESVAALCSS